MNKIINELKDLYDILQKAEFVFDDPTTKCQLYFCHHKLKQVIRTLETREQFDNKEDIKVEKLNEDFSYSDMAYKINEIIDRLNGEDNVSHKDSELT